MGEFSSAVHSPPLLFKRESSPTLPDGAEPLQLHASPVPQLSGDTFHTTALRLADGEVRLLQDELKEAQEKLRHVRDNLFDVTEKLQLAEENLHIYRDWANDTVRTVRHLSSDEIVLDPPELKHTLHSI